MIGTQVLVPEESNEGNYIRINRAGAVIEKGTYKNNKQEGLCEILYTDGTVSQELYFTADELDKTNRTFYENGNLSGIYPRDKGKKNGTEINYSKSGRVTRKQSFEMTKPRVHIINFSCRRHGRSNRTIQTTNLTEHILKNGPTAI
jgi:antitoxin component YwqK of YwqJK toxin-antitoxin module